MRILLTQREVTERYRIPRSSIYAMIQSESFPRPVKLSPRRSVWIESQVEDWFKQRVLDSHVSSVDL